MGPSTADQLSIIKKIISEIGKESDGLNNSKLNDLLKTIDNNNIPLAEIIKGSLDQLEVAYGIIIKNTDVRTFKIDDSLFEYFNKEEVLTQLRKIAFLSRRIEREVKEHYDNKKVSVTE